MDRARSFGIEDPFWGDPLTRITAACRRRCIASCVRLNSSFAREPVELDLSRNSDVIHPGRLYRFESCDPAGFTFTVARRQGSDALSDRWGIELRFDAFEREPAAILTTECGDRQLRLVALRGIKEQLKLEDGDLWKSWRFVQVRGDFWTLIFELRIAEGNVRRQTLRGRNYSK